MDKDGKLSLQEFLIANSGVGSIKCVKLINFDSGQNFFLHIFVAQVLLDKS